MTDAADTPANMRLVTMGVDRAAIEAFCRRHHIRKLSLFGSIIRSDFTADSDVDVLVEFDPAHIPGFEFFGMEAELSRLFGRQVDLKTIGFLSEHFRDDVIQKAKVYYAAT